MDDLSMPLAILRAFVVSVSENLEKFSQDEIAVSQELSREQEWLERANKLLEFHEEEPATKTDIIVLKQDIDLLNLELKRDLAKTKSEIILWMVGIGILQSALLMGVVAKVAKVI
jgi:hypothetical protein